MSDLEFDETFDFVVVGSGGGSMCAALYVRTLGKTVTVLEKMPLIGGTTSRSGGVMWIPNNRFMKQEGIEDSFEKSIEYMEATAGQSIDAPGTSLEKRRAYVAEGTRMVDFLVDQGIKLRRAPLWPDYYDDRPGGSVPGRTVLADIFDTNELGEWRDKLEPNFLSVPAYHSEGFELALMKSSWKGKLAMLKVALRMVGAKLTGKRLTQAGGALQGRMLQACLKAGADIRTDSGVKAFVMDNGAVKGVEILKDGRTWRIGARNGVLVNAGGFSHNQAMRDKYQPGTSAKWTAATPGSTGEMIIEMMKIGAAIGQMEEMVGNQMSIPPGSENTGNGVSLGNVGGQMNITKPYSIVVDQSGVRYMNEAGSYMEFCQNMLRRDKTVPAVPSWWIVDQQYMDTYMYTGTMAGTKKPQEWYDSGFLKRADTVDGLAGQIGVAPETLRETVERFNEGARKGVDTEFGRGNRAYDNWLGDFHREGSHTLGPIEKGPFYAAPVVPGDVGTYGGVVTDANARVLREDGTPIEGLYATGISTASVMGRIYPGAGSSIGPSFVFGYIAARHALHAHNRG
ncbi:FAD-dependent oxidoreductase [Novosphingobium malaysiense]|uniref:3-ketosteroid-delta-1-dehydrogenase n=1 Tax=Novosphingobium malaysiense TaxID=1348853 RepID=A0A0B1ZI38_9SPHN|nr:FAD-dependent oxidoreductase [Novosphingobium malaysiense]KHK90147.1 3-ketosteroid-delta-1-dehydrogenase [Novosphingobium malaysiense]